MPLHRLCSTCRESGLIETIGHLAWWLVVRVYLRLFHRLTVDGIENLPRRRPFVIVANHASHLDALVLASRLGWKLRDHTYLIAADDTFFDTTVHAAFSAAALNALPMCRRRCSPRALGDLRRRLIAERSVFVIFPEDTRTRDGRISRFPPASG